MFEARTFEDEKEDIYAEYMAEVPEPTRGAGQEAYVAWLERKYWMKCNAFADLAFVSLVFAIGVLITWL